MFQPPSSEFFSNNSLSFKLNSNISSQKSHKIKNAETFFSVNFGTAFSDNGSEASQKIFIDLLLSNSLFDLLFQEGLNHSFEVTFDLFNSMILLILNFLELFSKMLNLVMSQSVSGVSESIQKINSLFF